jgi:hypothetical protein
MYSLRRVVSTYNGPLVQVRRSSDGLTQNIGFSSSNELDTSKLLTFCASVSCTISTWYDQSASAAHATQGVAGNQPRIVNTGVVETLNSKPAVRFTAASQQFVETAATVNLGAATTTSAVFSSTGASTGSRPCLVGQSWTSNNLVNSLCVNIAGFYSFGVFQNSNLTWYQATLAAPGFPTSPTLSTGIYSGATATLFNTGTQASSVAAPSGLTANRTMRIGRRWDVNDHFDGHLSEVAIFNAALDTSNRTAAELSMSTYYALVPGAPSGVGLTPQNQAISASWSAPTSAAAVTDYVIEYKLSSDSSWTTLADGVSTSTSTTISGLTNGSSYDVRISAVSALGTGANSTPTSTTPRTVPDTPGAPTAVAGDGQVALSWTAVGDGGSPVTSYVPEYRALPSGAWTVYAPGVGVATATTVTGLTSGTVYQFRVSATNLVGSSGVSAASTATPLRISDPPTALVATPQVGAVQLSWTAPADNGGSTIVDYIVEYRLAPAGTWSAYNDGVSSATAATISGLTQGWTYEFRVAAVNSLGVGAVSTTATTTVTYEPLVIAVTPSLLVSGSTASVTWATNRTATSTLLWGPSTDTRQTQPATTTGLNHSTTITNLVACTTYFYRASSVGVDAYSTTTTTRSFTTPGCASQTTPLTGDGKEVPTSGGTTSLDTPTGQRATLVAPPAFTDYDVALQIKQLNRPITAEAGLPRSDLTEIAALVFDVKAIRLDTGEAVTEFKRPLTFSVTYTDADVRSTGESRLSVYRWSNNVWQQLPDCAIDTRANTISCTTTGFSVFSVFSSPTARRASSSVKTTTSTSTTTSSTTTSTTTPVATTTSTNTSTSSTTVATTPVTSSSTPTKTDSRSTLIGVALAVLAVVGGAIGLAVWRRRRH